MANKGVNVESLKLFKVFYMGDKSCFKLRVARSPEEALTKCFSIGERSGDVHELKRCCRAEEVTLDGYRIHIEKEQ
jgi:hypothetical protein